MPSSLGKGLDSVISGIEKEYNLQDEPELSLTSEQKSQLTALEERLSKSIIKHDKFGDISTDRDLIGEIVHWFFALPQNKRHIWRPGDTLRIPYSHEFSQLCDNSLKYFHFKERQAILTKMYEIGGPDPMDGDALSQRPEGAMYSLAYTKSVCDTWWGLENGMKMIPPITEHPIIDRSIEYWNARGHDFRRPA